MLDIPHQLERNDVIHAMNATIAHSLATLSAKVPGTERHRQHHHQHEDHRCAHGARTSAGKELTRCRTT